MPSEDLLSDPLLGGIPEHEGYKVLGGVVLYQKLGQGGMGAVYRGKHIRLNMDVAVKIMTPPAGIPPDAAEKFIQRFLREARTAANIRHQNLVRVSDVNTEGGVYYLVMDYVDGESAADRLERRRLSGECRLSEAEAVEIALGAADGLAEAHRRGIVHRDVKPDNVLIGKDGAVVLADLGLAKAFGSGEGDSALTMGLSVSQQAMGTPFYMSPEQTRSAKDVGPATDVWSLGATLYEFLTGEVPWRVTDLAELIMRIRKDDPPDLKALGPDLSAGVCAIVKKALAKDSAERYADCGEMADALRAHLEEIRAPAGSRLADPEAGKTKLAIVSVTPPPARTLTLIADAALARPLSPARAAAALSAPAASDSARAKATGATEPVRASSRGWVLPAVLGGAALLALAGVIAALVAGGERPAPATPDPLEHEAEVFYQEQSEAAAAGRHAEVVAAIKQAEGRYDNTSFGMRIRRLGEAASKRLDTKEEEKRLAEEAEKKREEAEAKSRRADFENAIAAADAAEEKGDLEEAVRQLKLALALKDAPALRERIAALERRKRLQRLLAEASSDEKSKKWNEAKAKYDEAVGLAEGEKKRLVRERLARVNRRIEIEEKVALVRREADAGRWRRAWDLIQEARMGGIVDTRLDDLSRRAVGELAPRKSIAGPLGIELVLVEGGAFMMGSASGGKDERPVHEVTVSSFYIGRHEVTKAQFDAYRRASRAAPGAATAEAREPVVSLSWQEAVAFCRYLTSIDPGGATCRLPTEAEWEFAARGSEGRTYPWGNELPTSRHANLGGESDGYERLAPVGSFPEGATPSGIHDLAGNAAEWCADWAGPYSPRAERDPTGPATGRVRVVRGGSFVQGASAARSSARVCRRPDKPAHLIGFRVVRELTEEEREFERLVKP